jgi:hypothetical protein
MNGADIYNIFIMGMEAICNIQQDGYSAKFVYRDPMVTGPLALNCEVGWKMACCPLIINDLWVLKQAVTLSGN